jgi:multidrug resistance efflux pump
LTGTHGKAFARNEAMNATDNPVDRTSAEPNLADQVDAQLQDLDAQMQNLLRKETAQPTDRASDAAAAQSLKTVLPPLAAPSPPRRLARRLVRPAIGAALLALAAWALLPLFLDLHSIQAVVNAPIITLRSPIEGTVTFRCAPTCGTKVDANAPLIEIKNKLADGDRLDALKDEQALLEARVASFRQQLETLGTLRDSLSASARSYRDARLRTLEVECEGARASLENAKAVERQRKAENEQVAQLQRTKSVSNGDVGATQSAAEAAHHAVVQAEKQVESVEEQIRALREGVYVGPGDGRNDLPYSTQRIHEIEFRLEEVRAALQQDEAKLAQLARHVRAETERQSRRTEFQSSMPADAVVWRPHVTGQTTVAADSPLVDVIDPAEIFIDAVIYESDMSRVKVGDAATVRLAGSRTDRKAVVKQVIGRSLPWPDPFLATPAVPAARQEIHVILAFAEPLPQGEGSSALPVGVPAQVTFVTTGQAMKALFQFWGE